MYFIISHFTNNLGTTDYLLQYFKKKEISYLFLRHPFQSEKELQYSELLYFDGQEERILKRYKKVNNFLFEMIRNILLSFFISIRYFWRFQQVIGFGGFNVFPVLWLRILGKYIYFWGVDYSRKRFGNLILNQIYLFLETLGCLFSSKTISSSQRQLEARIKYHLAKKEKSLVINNGVSILNFTKNFFESQSLGFFYLGSITPQHGILDFINYCYLDQKIKVPLYIIGGGVLEKDLFQLIEKNQLMEIIHFWGRKNALEISEFLEKSDKKLFGIAPYSDTVNDHVYYGDSLKIREYLSYNLPFLVSDIPYIADDIKKFGIIYKHFEHIDLDSLKNFSFDIEEKKQVLEKYSWNNLFSKEF